MSRSEDPKISLQEEKELKELLRDDSEEENGPSQDESKKEMFDLLNRLVNGFLNTHAEVVTQSNENRNGLQAEIDHLHKILVNVSSATNIAPKPPRDCELETLAKLRQIQTDQTANRVREMDAASRLISALKYIMKDSGKKSKGDRDLRQILNEDGENG